MGTTLFLAYFFVNCLAISVCFKKKIELVAAPFLFLNVTVIYLFGLFFPSLLVGTYLAFSFAAVAIAFLIYQGFKGKKNFWAQVRELCVTPGSFILLALFLFILMFNEGHTFTEWDEFSHWGLVYKNMVYFNRFGSYEFSTVSFKGYPPAVALWQYFVARFHRGYQDVYAYHAMGWLVSCLVIPAVSNFSWKKAWGACAFAFVLFFLPNIFVSNYFSLLYVDMILGVVFAYLLYFLFSTETKDLFYYLTLTLGMTFLCLIKATGAFFALVILALIVVETIREIRTKEGGCTRQNLLIAGLPILLSGIALLIGKFSWSWYLSANNVPPAWDTGGVTISGLFRFLSRKGPEYQYEVTQKFFDQIWVRDFTDGILNLAFIHWIAISAIGLASLFWLGKKKIVKRYGFVLFGGLFVYIIGMLVLYLFTYSEYEARNLASYRRYMATYIVGILLFVVSVFSNEFANRETTWKAKYVFLAFLSAFVCFFDGASIYNNAPNLSLQNYEKINPYLNQLDYKTDKIVVVSQGDQGFDRWVYNMVTTPFQSSGYFGGWSIGQPKYEGDVWTTDYTPDQWIETLIENDIYYIYLHRIDEEFLVRYGECFATEPQVSVMYELVKESDGTYLFYPLSLE